MTAFEIVWRLAAVAMLVGANGFFVAAEFALVGADDTRLSGLAERGDRLAQAVRVALGQLNYYLSSCQVGITLASLGLGWIGEPAIAETLVFAFEGLPSPFGWIARHTVAVIIAFTIITYLHVVLGEVAPKAAAIFYPETMARWLIRPLIAFTRLGQPLIWSINAMANGMLRVFGVEQPAEAERVHGRRELLLLVGRAREMGKVKGDEHEMISGVFELTGTVAREVMTPRRDIVAVPVDVTLDVLIDKTGSSGHSRLPVYSENLDNVVGIVLVKDVLPLAAGDGAEDFDISRVMREPYFVPDTKPVGDLLGEFRRLKIHMAIVVDEFGGTDGLVTLEDLIEEIVGEIYDEHDIARPLVTTAGGEVLIDGGAPLDEVNQRFGLQLPSEDYDTLGGFILGELGQVPKPGDTVQIAGAEFTVKRVDDRRIRSVRFVKLDRRE